MRTHQSSLNPQPSISTCARVHQPSTAQSTNPTHPRPPCLTLSAPPPSHSRARARALTEMPATPRAQTRERRSRKWAPQLPTPESREQEQPRERQAQELERPSGRETQQQQRHRGLRRQRQGARPIRAQRGSLRPRGVAAARSLRSCPASCALPTSADGARGARTPWLRSHETCRHRRARAGHCGDAHPWERSDAVDASRDLSARRLRSSSL